MGAMGNANRVGLIHAEIYGTLLKNPYEILNIRAIKYSYANEIHVFQYMTFIRRGNFKIS